MRGAPWAMVASDLLSHPKMAALEKRLNDPRAAFFVVATWLHFARFYCDGSMPDVPERRFALQEAAKWPATEREMVDVLVEAGFLKLKRGRVIVHGWDEWTGKYHAKLVRDRAEKRAKRRMSQGKCRATSHDGAAEKENETKNERENPIERTDSSETRSEPASPTVMILSCVGTGAREHVVSAADVAAYRGAFPALDVEGELRRMRVWFDANPTKRKTANGMPRFITAWLGRAQDRQGGSGGFAAPKPRVIAPVGDFSNASAEDFFRALEAK